MNYRSGHLDSFWKSNFMHYIPVVAMIFVIPLVDFIKLIYHNEYPSYLGLISLMYVFGYLYVIMFKVRQYKLLNILFLMTLIKIYFFFIAIIGDSFHEASLGSSDWARFHIPKSLEILNSGKDGVLKSMISSDEIYNGRLTHLVIMMVSSFLSYLGIDGTNKEYIAIASYFLSFILCPIIIFIYYKASYLYSNSLDFSRRAAFFLALNPFFLATTGNPQKEILLFLAIGIFLLFLVSSRGGLSYLLLSLCIIAFERIYLLPLLISMIFLIKNISFLGRISISLIALISVEYMIGLDRALSMHATHVESLISVDGSFLPGHGFLSNLVRGGFGPFFLRPFMSEYTSYTALGVSKYLLFLFFSLFFIKSIFNTEGILKVILLIYIFIILLLPFHGTLKLFLLIAFGGVFLDRISYVKYFNKALSGPIRGFKFSFRN